MVYAIGENVRFTCMWEYKGPYYVGAKLRCVIGKRGVSFDEVLYSQVGVIMPETLVWTAFEQTVLVAVTANLKAGETYDTYVKLVTGVNQDGPDDLFWYGDGLVTIAGGSGGTTGGAAFSNLSVSLSR
jgi:hypothetical protein